MLLQATMLKMFLKKQEFLRQRKDLYFIENKIGDFFGDRWHDAIEYALMELERTRVKKE